MLRRIIQSTLRNVRTMSSTIPKQKPKMSLMKKAVITTVGAGFVGFTVYPLYCSYKINPTIDQLKQSYPELDDIVAEFNTCLKDINENGRTIKTEKYDNGKLKKCYIIDRNGVRDGLYVEFYDNGVTKIKCN